MTLRAMAILLLGCVLSSCTRGGSPPVLRCDANGRCPFPRPGQLAPDERLPAIIAQCLDEPWRFVDGKGRLRMAVPLSLAMGCAYLEVGHAYLVKRNLGAAARAFRAAFGGPGPVCVARADRERLSERAFRGLASVARRRGQVLWATILDLGAALCHGYDREAVKVAERRAFRPLPFHRGCRAVSDYAALGGLVAGRVFMYLRQSRDPSRLLAALRRWARPESAVHRILARIPRGGRPTPAQIDALAGEVAAAEREATRRERFGAPYEPPPEAGCRPEAANARGSCAERTPAGQRK